MSDKPKFRLKTSNGEIIAASQAYADKPSCMKGIVIIGVHAPDADIMIVESELLIDCQVQQRSER